MPPHTEFPNFFRIFYDEVMPLRKALTQVQCQKLIGAMALYFLFDDEPQGLSRDTQLLFDSQRARLDRYRTSVINGQKNGQKTSKKDAKKSKQKSSMENQTSLGRLPAETQESGTHPETDPDGIMGGGVGYPQKKTVNSKEKTPPPPEDDLSEFIDP